ncbi:uncharacterized protein, partial [Leuresthes tenuis]|uniref:uncharacterized protein n=1 Tax=Leuresthes tenuis TaxID=355514 RepID=UPI003B503C6A
MSWQQYEWAEEDFLPPGVSRLIAPKPDDNRTYVMYHGTTRANAQSIKTSGFRRSSDGMLGPGVYLSRNLDKASRYPINHPEHDRVVIKVKVNVGRVIAINCQDHPLRKTWHYKGYDTAWVPPNCGMVKSGLEEDCVWDTSRITILKRIKPKPVYSIFSNSSILHPRRGSSSVDPSRDPAGVKKNMSWQQYKWAEDDFLPPGVSRLKASQSDDNRTYVMYHGTTRANAQSIKTSGFRRSSAGMLGPGVYLSRDLDKASRYPIGHPEQDRVVIQAKVNVGRVIAINHQDHPFQKTWHYHGYDTAWVPPNCGMVKSGLEEDCVWDPSRITILQLIKPKPVSVQPSCHSPFTLDEGSSEGGSQEGSEGSYEGGSEEGGSQEGSEGSYEGGSEEGGSQEGSQEGSEGSDERGSQEGGSQEGSEGSYERGSQEG